MLISNVCFLDTGMKRMTCFIKGIGGGHYIIIIIIKELFFFLAIRTGLDTCVLQGFSCGQPFSGVIPTLLDL